MTEKIDHVDELIQLADKSHGTLTDRLKKANAVAQHIRKLEELVRDMATDLFERISAEYPDDVCAKYPDQRRKRDRDMEAVNKARALGLKE